MKNLFIFIVLLLIVAGGVGYWQGWFKVKRQDGGLTAQTDPEKLSLRLR